MHSTLSPAPKLGERARARPGEHRPAARAPIIERLEPRTLLSSHRLFTHTTHKLSVPYYQPDAVTAGQFVLVSDRTHSSVDVYDAVSGHWSVTSAPPQTTFATLVPPPLVVGQRVVYVAQAPSDPSHSFLDIYDTATAQWSSTSAPDEVQRGSEAVVGSKVIYAGGVKFGSQSEGAIDYTDVAIYDVAAGQWSSGTLSQGRQPQIAVVGDKAVFGGGIFARQGQSLGPDAVDIYDADTGQWSSTTLSVARTAIAATVDDKALFAGGFGDYGGPNAGYHADVDIYDATTGAWSTAQLSKETQFPSVAIVDHLAIFASAENAFSDAVDVYDAVTGQWTPAKLSEARTQPAVAVVAHKAIFAGGVTLNGLSRAVDIYDADTGLWSTARLSSRRNPVTAVAGSLALFASGAYLKPGSAVDIFNSATGKWSTSSLAQSRDGPAAATVNDQALFIGGIHGKSSSRVVDIFTPVAARAATAAATRTPGTASQLNSAGPVHRYRVGTLPTRSPTV